jgi:hypothetical protein
MLTAIIAAVATLIGAAIAAFVTFRMKKLDLAGHSEQRRHDSLKRGYDLTLAAYDLFWHYRCHLALSDLGHEAHFAWKEQWHPLRTRVQMTFTGGIDLLKENSLHYDRLSPALVWMSTIALKGTNLKHLQAMPEDYEEARTTLIRFRRIDERIDKPVGRSFWKKVSKNNKPPEIAELTSEEHIRRIFAMVDENPNMTYVYQSGPGDDPDDNPFLELITRFAKWPPIFLASLIITSGRVNEWKASGAITYSTPCDDSDEECFLRLQRKLEADRSSS